MIQVVRTLRILKDRRLSHEIFLFKKTMQKSIMNVKLKRPTTSNNKRATT
jgi:hypothetical protein